MTDEPHPLDLSATLSRLEPGMAPVGIELAAISIAVSLKRIADELPNVQIALQDVRYAINLVSNNGQSIPSAVTSLNGGFAGISSALKEIHATINTIRTDENIRRDNHGQGVYYR